MVKYLLDTCAVIKFLRGDDGVQNQIISHGIDNCAISELSLAELFVGPERLLKNASSEIERRRAIRQIQSLDLLQETFTILPLSNFAMKFAEVHEMLRMQGEPIEDMDLLIGTFALSNDFVLVTGNVRHFSRISGLHIEDW